MVEGHLRSVTSVFVEFNNSHFKRFKDYGTGLFHSTDELSKNKNRKKRPRGGRTFLTVRVDA